MAAWFTFEKNNLKLLDNFIQKDFNKKNSHLKNSNKYDLEISSSSIKDKLIKDINKLRPFGIFNFSPIFLIKNLRIIKQDIINNKHLSVILKPESGVSIKGICFNCLNTNIGNNLL